MGTSIFLGRALDFERTARKRLERVFKAIQVLKIHAGYALKLGVKPDELKEIVYLTTVTAGFPRAIEAAQALREVFNAQPANAISR
jgi:alkylhydroperoxidase/carboxymuconolactone decarboxylase family protein YurZ